MDVTRLRIGLVAALGALLAVGAGGAFDAVQWPLFVPVAMLAASAALTAGARRIVRLVVAVGAVALSVVVTVLAAGGPFRDVPDAFARGPRLLLTTEWPSPAVPVVVGAVAAVVATSVAVAAELAARRRLHLAALAPLAVGWTVVLAIGAPVRPAVWIVVASGVLAVLLALVRHGSTAPRLSQLVLGDRTLALSATAIGVVGIITASAVAWADRADPRRTEEAQLNAAVIDPIEAMVALRAAEPPFTVFSITDRSRLAGQSLPARWRVAALDTYDGQRWVPQLELRPIGARLGLPSPVDLDRSPPISYLLEFRTDDFDLLPFPGPPLSVDTDVETDVDRVVVRALERPDVGDVVRVESEVGLTSRSTIGPNIALGVPDETAARFADIARRIGGGESPVEQLRRIEETMREDWELDSQAPGGGQQLALIERFVTETRRGTSEQFVTGFVMLARALGVEARVATGFVVPVEQMGSPLQIESTMASVWPEIRSNTDGWVAFDPVPETQALNDDQPPPPPQAQTPAAAQPPIAPPTDDTEEPDQPEVEAEEAAGRWERIRVWIVRGGAIVGLGVLPFAVAVLAILLIKWRRTRRRVLTGDPAARIRGAWANVTDSLVDAGLSIAPSWTDDRIATSAVPLAPTVPHELRRLAAMSTEATFAGVGAAPRQADDALSTARAVHQAIRDDRTSWQLILWRLSLRSLRASSRSPVAP